MIRPIVFGKFILLERVSVGGMAEVFRAKLLDAPQFERFFAIKRILPNLAVDDEFINMFIDEAKITVELDHPNVCQIYELGRLGKSHYIAMEYIPGRDVLAIQNIYRRQKKIMSVSQACFITMQVAQGLDYAHRAVDSAGQPLHLIHRDVSPQNLLVSFEGLVKLIDFGIAKAASKTTKTKSGVLKGKFGYMSPEQAANAYVDHRSDVFALGTVFWEMLTGRRLFHSESELAILQLITECDVTLPSKLNRNVPPEVDHIAMKALEKDPDKRYHWAGEMVRDLRDFIMSCKPPFTQWHLQNWMCANFAEELEAEWNKLPIFQSINTAEDVERYNSEKREKELAAQAEQFTEKDDSEVGDERDSDLLDESSDELLSDDDLAKDLKNKKPAPFPAKPKLHPPKYVPAKLPAFKALKSDNEAHHVSETSDDGKQSEETLADETPTQDLEAVQSPNSQKPDKQIEKTRKSSQSNVKISKMEGSGSLRLEGITAKDDDSADSELVPEPVAPDVYDPQLLQLELAARRRLTKRFLLVSIGILLLMLVVMLVLMKTGFLKFGSPDVLLPTTANLQLEVVPISDETEVSIYRYTDTDIPLNTLKTGSKAFFERLEAGRYIVEVNMPAYEKERFVFSLDNANYESRIEMTKPVPEVIEYEVNLPFEDAEVLLNNKIVHGTGLVRKLKGILGQEYQLTVKKDGYISETQKIIIGQEDSYSFSLNPGEAVLYFDAEPSAHLWVQDDSGWRRVGSTPYTLSGIDPTKALHVELRARSYETWNREIKFSDKFERKFYVVLERTY